ncbi:MAG: NnrS family protein [Acidiferrobacterales bacterium]|nr:NnrS family protein [Acidiferrobacterales bacterium]
MQPSRPVFFSHGFRPFFLFAALWALLSMMLWILMLLDFVTLPIAVDPISWHAHEALFGYLSAVLAGFLLTAVPNWTDRPPLDARILLLLFLLWILGRVAVLFGSFLPTVWIGVFDLSFLLMLALLILREIGAARNWRNLPVVAIVGVLLAGNAVFHIEAANDACPVSGYGTRIGVGAAVMMITLIGGRIVPAFTGNWLKQHNKIAIPASFGWFDMLALATTLIGLVVWIGSPASAVTGVLLLVAGFIQTVRLIRWRGFAAASEALVWILHAGYAFVPLGMLAIGFVLLQQKHQALASVQHLWMAGAIGVMTLAVMTRATLGHTGRQLTANSATIIVYLLVIVSVLMRSAVGMAPDHSIVLWTASSFLWCAGFAIFLLTYGPMLTQRSQNTGAMQ